MGMTSFIAWLLNSSLMGSALIGLIIVVRMLVKNRLGANWQYLIWFLLIIRLLIPYAPESSLSVFNIFSHLTVQILSGSHFDTQDYAKLDRDSEKPSVIRNIVNATADYSIPINKTFPARDGFLFWIWLFGVISLTSYTIYLTIKMKRIIRNGFRVTDSRVIGLIEECKRTVNVKSNPVLIESPQVRVPMVVGSIRPHIILPTGIIGNFSDMELRFILLHELTHLHRGDLYINWITSFLQIIYWFNPLVWYAFYQMRQDRELACDADVLSALKPDEYKSYGAAIISVLERYSYPSCDYTIAGLASGKAHIKKRLTMIASYKKRTVSTVVLGILLIFLMGCFVLTDAEGTFGPVPAEKPQMTAYEDLSSYFQGYAGTFVLLDMETDRYRVYNDANSKKRVSPDSTYKIISSLVGLETGVLIDENTRLEWDGTVYPFEPWNKDQSLASASSFSVNWYFQRIDSIVGKTKIEDYLKRSGYGNYDLTGDINNFWNESSLEISPMEQVEFLEKLYNYKLPFSRKNIDIVKKVIKVYEQDKVIVYGKTGTGIVNGDSINGWFVGFVENKGKVYIFATNIQGSARADGITARNITLSILKDKSIL